jgi:putative salt-induced outer membrane protein
MVKIVLTAFLFLMPVVVFAQAAPPAPPPQQEGNAEFALVSTTGNSDTQTLGLAGEYHYRPDVWHLQWKAGYVRNESNNILSAESLRFLFRTDRSLTARSSVFGQYTYLHDAFAAIDHRNVIAGGLSYQLIPPDPHELWVDGGIGYTNEQRLVGDDISTAIGLTGARYKFRLSDTAEVSDDLGLEFSFSNGDDWHLNNLAAVTAKLTTVFALKLSYTTRYVNAPAPGIETTDTITAVALVAKF